MAAKKLKVQEIDEVAGTFLVSFFWSKRAEPAIGLKPDPSRKGGTCHFLDG